MAEPLIPLPVEFQGVPQSPQSVQAEREKSLMQRLNEPIDIGQILGAIHNPSNNTGLIPDLISGVKGVASSGADAVKNFQPIKDLNTIAGEADAGMVLNSLMGPDSTGGELLQNLSQATRNPQTGLTEENPIIGAMNAVGTGAGKLSENPINALPPPIEFLKDTVQRGVVDPLITPMMDDAKARGEAIRQQVRDTPTAPPVGPSVPTSQPTPQPPVDRTPSSIGGGANSPQELNDLYRTALMERLSGGDAFQDQVNQTREEPNILQQIGRAILGAQTGFRGGNVAALQRQFQDLDENLTPQQQVASQAFSQSQAQTDPNKILQSLMQMGLFPGRERLLSAQADAQEAQTEAMANQAQLLQQIFQNPNFLSSQ